MFNSLSMVACNNLIYTFWLSLIFLISFFISDSCISWEGYSNKWICSKTFFQETQLHYPFFRKYQPEKIMNLINDCDVILFYAPFLSSWINRFRIGSNSLPFLIKKEKKKSRFPSQMHNMLSEKIGLSFNILANFYCHQKTPRL